MINRNVKKLRNCFALSNTVGTATSGKHTKDTQIKLSEYMINMAGEAAVNEITTLQSQ